MGDTLLSAKTILYGNVMYGRASVCSERDGLEADVPGRTAPKLDKYTLPPADQRLLHTLRGVTTTEGRIDK